MIISISKDDDIDVDNDEDENDDDDDDEYFSDCSLWWIMPPFVHGNH